jgi:hypothetical protein
MAEFTGDLRIHIKNGFTNEQLAQEIFNLIEANIENPFSDLEIAQIAQDKFGLSEEDSAFSVERVYGGIFRGITRNNFNKPKENKDPLAYFSFNKVMDSYKIKTDWWNIFAVKTMKRNKWDDFYDRLWKNNS